MIENETKANARGSESEAKTKPPEAELPEAPLAEPAPKPKKPGKVRPLIQKAHQHRYPPGATGRVCCLDCGKRGYVKRSFRHDACDADGCRYPGSAQPGSMARCLECRRLGWKKKFLGDRCGTGDRSGLMCKYNKKTRVCGRCGRKPEKGRD